VERFAEQHMNTDEQAREVEVCLDEHLRESAPLADRIYRQLLIALHTRGIVSIDAIHDEARTRGGHGTAPNLDDPNKTERDRLDQSDRIWVNELTRKHVCRHFACTDVNDLVNLALKREEAHVIEDLANLSNVSFRALSEQIERFAGMPEGETKLAPAEVMGTRVSLIRHFVSDQLEYIGVAKHYLWIRGFGDLVNRLICTDQSNGKIGGKAGGMLL